jgi:signal transduction histidine kinase
LAAVNDLNDMSHGNGVGDEAGIVPTDLDVSSTLEAMSDAACVFDRSAELVFINSAALRIFGFATVEEARAVIEGRSHGIEIIRSLDGRPNEYPELIRQALNGVFICEEVERLTHSDTRPHVYLRISIRPIVNQRGVIVGVLKIGKDITFEFELAKLKDEFVSITSHELRTPATILRLAAHRLLTGDVSSDERLTNAERIDRAARRIESMSVKLIDIAAISTGRVVALDLTEFSLDDLVAEVVASVQDGQSNRVRLTTTNPVTVRADAKRLRQVVDALLDNALRYSSADALVDLAVEARDGLAEVTVTDHGIGIPASKQSQIFEQFYRAHTNTPFDRGGLGVSLYLADHIMKAHGGRIWFASDEATGSAFHIALRTAA